MDLTPSKNGSLTSAPWDMDFKGHWEMERDLIGEFIKQQKGGINHHNKKNHHHHQYSQQLLCQNHRPYYNNDPPDQFYNINNYSNVNLRDDVKEIIQQQSKVEDEDDEVMLKCLPNKLIIDDDESLVDDTLNTKVKPCNNKEAFSISSLKSKFDENVKAIWSDVDGNDPMTMKPLTYKHHHFDDDGRASLSLASSFTSEKNSLSLFNLNEQTTHHFEVNAPSCTENYYYHQQQQQQLQPSYDCNNNNHNSMVFYGGRGAISKSSSFTASPKQSDQMMMKSTEFIKSGTNLQTSIWSDGGDFASDAESLIFKEVSHSLSLSQ